jgi:hypothetical protein
MYVVLLSNPTAGSHCQASAGSHFLCLSGASSPPSLPLSVGFTSCPEIAKNQSVHRSIITVVYLLFDSALGSVRAAYFLEW